MAATPYAAMVDRDDVDFELREIDERILDELERARCTRRHLADLLGVSPDYIYQRIDLLQKLGVVDVIHDGFYQLAGDVDSAGDEQSGGSIDIRAAVEAADWGGSNYARTDARVDALVKVVEYLRQHGRGTTKELVPMLEDELGEEPNNQRMLSDICKTVEGVEGPTTGSNVYRWVGDD